MGDPGANRTVATRLFFGVSSWSSWRMHQVIQICDLVFGDLFQGWAEPKNDLHFGGGINLGYCLKCVGSLIRSLIKPNCTDFLSIRKSIRLDRCFLQFVVCAEKRVNVFLVSLSGCFQWTEKKPKQVTILSCFPTRQSRACGRCLTRIWLASFRVSMRIKSNYTPRRMLARHHQDYEPLLGLGIPTYKPCGLWHCDWNPGCGGRPNVSLAVGWKILVALMAFLQAKRRKALYPDIAARDYMRPWVVGWFLWDFWFQATLDFKVAARSAIPKHCFFLIVFCLFVFICLLEVVDGGSRLL